METYVLRDGKLVPKDEAPRRAPKPVVQIMPDLKPYRSIITNEVIGGRRQHREHLREHNCFEVGNETPAFIRERRERRGEKV